MIYSPNSAVDQQMLIQSRELLREAMALLRGSDHLVNDSDVLRAAITLRNPYVDALSLLQITLLRRKRAAPEGSEERARAEEAVAATLSGIAQGLRNTG